jgi:hydrogenase 3 maturation protease
MVLRGPQNIKQELSQILLGKVLIVGIGNPLRSDDGFGPALIQRIKDKIKADCLDAGLSPENYIGKIISLKPDTILFIDTVSMNEEVATMKLIEEDQIPEYGFSTHNMSPILMIENIKGRIKTKIFLLGIEPKSLKFGEEISEELKQKLTYLENIFIEALGKNANKKT